MKFGKYPKEKKEICLCPHNILFVPEPYLRRTCSVHSSVRGTSERRMYGVGTEQVHPRHDEDKIFSRFRTRILANSYFSHNLHQLITISTKDNEKANITTSNVSIIPHFLTLF